MNKILEELGKISYGKDYKSNPKGDGEIPIIGTGGVMGYTTIPLNTGKAVLTGRKGSINNPIYIEGDFWNVDTIFCIKAKEGVSAKWLYYNLANTDLTKLNEATGVPSVNSASLYKLRFKYFEYNIQTKIAKILTTIDNVIEKTEEAIAKYEAIKQGMMHDLFTRGIGEDGQLRPSFEEASELYKESALGWIPKAWEVVTLEEFASSKKYAIVDGPFGSNLKSIHYRDKGIPIIQSGFVTSNEFIAHKYLYVTKEKYLSEIRSSVSEGDIVMAKIGAQCGTCAILPKGHQTGIIAGNCLKITVGDSNNSIFLLTYLHILRKNGKMDLIISTTAQPAVSMSSLKKIYVPKPLIKEQELIAERIEVINKKITTEKDVLSKQSQLKKGLMQDLLTGKVSVTP